MPILLFRLNGVPDDEADDVRQLLSDHQVDYYETQAGRWGISVAAVWLRDDTDLERARRLIDDYQAQRTARARAEYEALRREGRHETLLGRLFREPARVLVYAALIAGVLYLMATPVMFLR